MLGVWGAGGIWLWLDAAGGGSKTNEVLTLHKKLVFRGREAVGDEVQRQYEFSFDKIELKSLILAQIERWRHALHMQVERQRGATWGRAANGSGIHRNVPRSGR